MHNMHLYIDGLRIPIRNFYYHFTQYTDQRNKPVSRVLGGEFGFSYEPTNENLSLTEWMVDPFETILNFFDNRNTNANAESFNSKIKLFRANQRGVRDTSFFLYQFCFYMR